MGDLSGKVALVTGASRGIGAAIATRLAGEGADVAITYRSARERAEAVVAGIEQSGRRALAIAADSGDGRAVVAAVNGAADRLGRLDILVNNAGTFAYGVVDEVPSEQVDRILAVHVRGVYLASQAAASRMPDGGRIISIGSCFAERVPYPGISLYATSKSALVGMTRGLARDLGPRGITVNLVHPGSTDTEMNPADGEGAALERSFIALGRYAAPAEIADTIAHLAADTGRYITGASISVDGGFAA